MDVRAIMAADNSSDDGDDTGVFDAQPQTQPLPPPPQQQSQLQQYQAPAATGTGGGGGGAVSALVQGIGGSGSGGKTGGGGPARFQQQVGAAAGAAAAGAVPERRKKTNELAELHDGDDDEDVSEEAHVDYVCARVTGGRPHPGHVVETRALAACVPPPLTYKARIPRRLADSGALSRLQLEAALYCCQMHERRLPNGERAGWLLGDNTGIGKGRIIAAVIMENQLRGRDRAVWATASPFLAAQIKRDIHDIGLRIPVWELSEQPLRGNGNLWHLGPGLMITTYQTLLRKPKKKPGDEAEEGVTRIDQLLSWLGGAEWNGVLALDEAHKVKNFKSPPTAPNGGRGNPPPPAKSAELIFKLQQRLRNARVVYSSATIATSPNHLECLARLGLWGPGTAFSNSTEFAEAMRGGGLPALELLALNLKSEGKYLTRCLGFKDCGFEVLPAPMSPGFEGVYDECARQWDKLRQELEAIAPSGSLGRKCEQQKNGAKLWSMFWSTHQRFFKSLYVASKVPFVIEQAKKALDDGYAPVIGLQMTGEAQVRGEMARTEDDLAHISPAASIFERFVEGIPDDLGEGIAALIAALKQRHLQWLDGVRVHMPGNPLDTLIDALGGPAQVAELTGRRLRPTAAGTYEAVNVNHEKERVAFMNGKKRVAIISDAASTGISLHADRKTPSAGKRRVHFCLELAWGADKVMQQLGRTHRSNQASGPIYKLITSQRLGGDTRFVATVARRLQILGAITQGHEGAANQTLDLRDFNVESNHGARALTNLLAERPGHGARITEAYSLLSRRISQLPVGSRSQAVSRFLNTVLGFELGVQHAVMDGFFRHWASETVRAKQEGVYEQAGIFTVKAEKVDVSATEPPRSYLARPPRAAREAEAATPAAAVMGAAAAGAAVPPTDAGAQEEQQKLTVVTLTLDRGISFAQAMQMLLLATAGGIGDRGGNGFYQPTGQPHRPLLALRRPSIDDYGLPMFKVLRPDIGREAFQYSTQSDLDRMRFLTPEEAGPLWTQRYEAARTMCMHMNNGGGRVGRCVVGRCTVGTRLKTCHILTFNPTQHWTLVQELLFGQQDARQRKKRRLRILRAETTTAPRQRFVGVMLDPEDKAQLEGLGLRVVEQQANATPTATVSVKQEGGGGGGGGGGGAHADGRVDVVTLLKEAGEEAGEKMDLVDLTLEEEEEDGDGGGSDDEEEGFEEEDGSEWEEEELLKCLPWDRKGSRSASGKRARAGETTDVSPASTRRRLVEEIEKDEDEVEIVESAGGGGGGCTAMDVGASTHVKQEPSPPRSPSADQLSQGLDEIVISEGAKGKGRATGSEATAAQAGAVGGGQGQQQQQHTDDDELLNQLEDRLDVLQGMDLLQQEEVRTLRRRAIRHDDAVLAAFAAVPGGGDGEDALEAMAAALRGVLGAAV